MAQTWVEKHTADPERMKAFQQERLILEVTELISRLMEEQSVSKTQLADRLGKTKGYITQLLDGRANMTLRTVSDVLFVLGRTLVVSDVPLTISTAWPTEAATNGDLSGLNGPGDEGSVAVDAARQS